METPKKPPNGSLVKTWYENGEFDKIEKYVSTEAEAFLEFLQKIIKNMKKLLE